MNRREFLKSAVAIPLAAPAIGPDRSGTAASRARTPAKGDSATTNALEIEIISPEANESVERSFSATGALDGFAATQDKKVAGPFVKCVLFYEDESTFTHGAVEVDLTLGGDWDYPFVDAPVTPANEVTGLVAFVLDDEGEELGAPYGPVDITILAADVGAPPIGDPPGTPPPK